MDGSLRKRIERFVEDNIVIFHQGRASNLAKLKLTVLLNAKNPYLFRARNLESAPDLIRALLDARRRRQALAHLEGRPGRTGAHRGLPGGSRFHAAGAAGPL